MENLDLANVTGSISAPFLKSTGGHLNSAINTLGNREYAYSIPATWNNSTTIVVLKACRISTIVQNGLVFYNGTVYDFENPNALADGYFAIQTSYLGTDPVKYSDNNNYSQHRIVKMILQASSLGSTTVLYSSTSTRHLEVFENDKGYASNKTIFGQASVTGNQFQIEATNASLADVMSVKLTNTGIRKGAYIVYDMEVKISASRTADGSSNLSSDCKLTVDLSNIFNQTDIVLEQNNGKIGFWGILQHASGILFHRASLSWSPSGRKLDIPLTAIDASGTTINLNTTTTYQSYFSNIRVRLLIL